MKFSATIMEFVTPCREIYIKMKTDSGAKFGYLLKAPPGEMICGFQRAELTDQNNNVCEIYLERKFPMTPGRGLEDVLTTDMIEKGSNVLKQHDLLSNKQDDIPESIHKKMNKNDKFEKMKIERDVFENKENDIKTKRTNKEMRVNKNTMKCVGNKMGNDRKLYKRENEKITKQAKSKFTPKPRPVMKQTNANEIKEKILEQQNEKTNYPTVEENMKHSLRFWLAVYYYEKKANNMKMCEHFDVSYSSVNRAAHNNWKAKDYNFYSPAEGGKRGTSRTNFVRMHGRKKDIEKYVYLKQWPEID